MDEEKLVKELREKENEAIKAAEALRFERTKSRIEDREKRFAVAATWRGRLKALNMSQAQFCRESGIADSNLSYALSRTKAPSWDMIAVANKTFERLEK